MKKIYVLLTAANLIAATGVAQQRIAKVEATSVPSSSLLTPKNKSSIQTLNVIDTLTAHLNINTATPVTYTSLGGGYVAGQNTALDKGAAQKFDAAYGVTTDGSVNTLLFWFGRKRQAAGTAAFTPTIWADNAGMPGAVLATATPFTVAQIDTMFPVAYFPIGPLSAVEGVYNVVATFSSPVAIPANKIFWAGVTFTYAAGDSAGLVTSLDPQFTNATTHTFAQFNNNTWNSYPSTWGLAVALGIYPVVDFTVGMNESHGTIASIQTAPNPVVNNTVINYELKEAENVSISVIDITGKEVIFLAQGMQAQGNHKVKLDVSTIPAGMYFYTLTAGNYKTTKKIAVVK